MEDVESNQQLIKFQTLQSEANMYDLNKCLKNKSTNWENHAEIISLYKEALMQINGDNHHPKLARVIALINQSSSSIGPSTCTSSMFLDTMFPAHETYSADSTNAIFGGNFGTSCQISYIKWFIQRVANDEMLSIYSIPVRSDNSIICDQYDILDDLLHLRIPWTFWSNIMEDDNQSKNMLDYFTLGDTNQCDNIQSYFT